MKRRSRQWTVGMALALTAALAAPGLAMAAGPVRFADGQPDGDDTLSVLTPAEAAFVQGKLEMADAVGAGASQVKARDGAVAYTACEFDPCEDPDNGWPSGVPSAKTLGTKARQQINSYFCGPASGQVIINWTRGITSGSNSGEDPSTNWKKQSKIAEWMSTTTAGTTGSNLAIGLNNPNGVLKPTANWIYSYADTGSKRDLFDKIVVDVAGYSMPLVLATAPHVSGAGEDYLESWPRVAAGAHHWIVIRGYDGVAGDPDAIIRYQDSSATFGGSTGAFADSLAVMWQVNEWNQGGHIVW